MTMTITRLSGNGFSIAIGDRHGVVLDPVTSTLPGPCQYVLLTRWTEELWQAASGIAKTHNAIIVVSPHLAGHLETLYKDSPGNIMPLGTDQEVEFPWGSLTPVACAHEYLFPNDPAPYLANGYVLGAEGHFLYYAGPTAMFPGLRDTGKLFKPNVSMLPVGEMVLNGQDLCQAVMWLGSDIVLPFMPVPDDTLKGETYSLIDMFTPAICRFLGEGDAYMLAPVETTGRTAGPEARY